MEGECPDEIKFSSLEVVILVNSGAAGYFIKIPA